MILHLLHTGTRRTLFLACGLAITSAMPALPDAALPLAVAALFVAFIRSCFERDGLHGESSNAVSLR
ncbi:MAG TPA: hypothetical protein PKA88_31960 [Polyangiaceae bacterium]|nr:hypothetical protein [Polyangiaceae bacterium]HMR74025.1 hypothetical protein [Polyangiaceae bacterium]